MKTPTRARVTVIGSLNIDYIARVTRLPRAGETLQANSLVQLFGGKGANQAIACARQGVPTAMLGCLGRDRHGDAYEARLKREGLVCDGLCRTSTALSGTALIAVDDQGENNIIVAAGANGELNPAHIRRNARLIRGAKILLAQFETPIPAVSEAFDIATRARVPIVLNPSPMRDDFPWGMFELDTLIVNEGEARILFGKPAVKLAYKDVQSKRTRHLVVTRGGKSTLLIDANHTMEIPVLEVKPQDTVGAGDAFAGAYAAWRAEGADLATAIRHANIAGALTTLKQGAQEAMPNRQTTLRQSRALQQTAGGKLTANSLESSESKLL
jgi:ribokinase